MKKIYKYPIEVTDEQTVLLPLGAVILTIQAQGDAVCLWALVDTNVHEKAPATIRIHGTGHDVPDAENLQYISTFQLMGGALVFHSFILM